MPRCADSGLGGIDGAGCAVRGANAAKESDVYNRRDRHARARDRRQHGYFPVARCSAAAEFAQKPNPQSLALIGIHGGDGGWGISRRNYDLTNPLWEEIRRQQNSFSSVFAWESDNFPIGEEAQARHAPGLFVSGEFFPTLGIRPALGRLFGPDDDRPGCAASDAVISHGFWKSEFGGTNSAIGSKLVILDRPYHVIGITPETFTGLEVGKIFDFIVPLCAQRVFRGSDSLTRRDYFWLTVMGRLRPGRTLDQASSETTLHHGRPIRSHDAERL